uniref:DUF4220 domain-containing protein n=1 Tax=Setaria italica TaxID=4555 RepID=K3ZLP9_SETIT
VDLEHAKELWDEWGIHCLILVSLFLQVFLFLTADMRRRSGSRVIMMALWLAYLSADTVAIFVLGHLAVYDTITAFSKQDNELWTRHLLSLVSQVAMAGYVVSKSSWPDARLRAAMVLAFFRGFFKYAGRTLCLYYSSPKSLRALSLGSVSDSIERLGHGMSGARRMIEEIFEIMFVADMCWKFVGRMTGGLTFPDLIHIMSVDAVVNDSWLIQFADELPDMLEEGPTAAAAAARGRREGADRRRRPRPTRGAGSRRRPAGGRPPPPPPGADAGGRPPLLVPGRALARHGPSCCGLAQPDKKVVGPGLDRLLGTQCQPSPARKSFGPNSAGPISAGPGWVNRCMAYQYVAAIMVGSYRALYTKTLLPFYVGFLLDRHVENRYVLELFTNLIFLIPILFQYLSTTIALVLFAAAEKKRPYSQADIIVSYLLLVGAIVLDLLPVFTSIVSLARKPFRPGTAREWAIMCLGNCFVPQGWQTTKQWSEELAQYSMISRYNTSNACMPSLRKWTGKCFGAWCVEFFDTTRTPGPAPVTDDLKLLVLDKLLLQTCRQEWDIASFRGERALEKWMGSHQVPETRRSGYAALHMSVSSRVEFPRSVLILHIATDICYFSEDTETDEAKKKKMMSRELSLYIMYLVFKCDVMLTSISRLAHEQAHEELKEIISGRQSPQGNLDEKEAIMEVIEAMKKEEQQKGSMLKEVIYTPVLSRVYAVARELMAIDDEASRWDLISEVWLEVLFYTAPRCGAAFHYEHLSTGGEFISHVLHLMRLLCPFMPNPGA